MTSLALSILVATTSVGNAPQRGNAEAQGMTGRRRSCSRGPVSPFAGDEYPGSRPLALRTRPLGSEKKAYRSHVMPAFKMLIRKPQCLTPPYGHGKCAGTSESRPALDL